MPPESAKNKMEDVGTNVQGVVQQAQEEVRSSREPWYQVSKRARILIGLNFIVFIVFALLAWFVHVHPIISIDVMITKEFQENQTPWLKTFMVAVSYLGNNALVFSLLIAITALAFYIVRLRLEALIIVGLSVISSILNVVLKVTIGRPRPNAKLVDILQTASGLSFPSGHVMSYVAFFGLLFCLGLMLFKRDRWWNYLLLIIPGLFVVLVGPSRIYLGDHWASDVIGGYLFGGLLLGLTLGLYVALKERGILTPRVKKPGEHLLEPNAKPHSLKI